MTSIRVLLVVMALFSFASCSHFSKGKGCCSNKAEKSCCKDKKDCKDKKECKDGSCEMKKSASADCSDNCELKKSDCCKS